MVFTPFHERAKKPRWDDTIITAARKKAGHVTSATCATGRAGTTCSKEIVANALDEHLACRATCTFRHTERGRVGDAKIFKAARQERHFLPPRMTRLPRGKGTTRIEAEQRACAETPWRRASLRQWATLPNDE